MDVLAARESIMPFCKALGILDEALTSARGAQMVTAAITKRLGMAMPLN